MPTNFMSLGSSYVMSSSSAAHVAMCGKTHVMLIVEVEIKVAHTAQQVR